MPCVTASGTEVHISKCAITRPLIYYTHTHHCFQGVQVIIVDRTRTIQFSFSTFITRVYILSIHRDVNTAFSGDTCHMKRHLEGSQRTT